MCRNDLVTRGVLFLFRNIKKGSTLAKYMLSISTADGPRPRKRLIKHGAVRLLRRRPAVAVALGPCTIGGGVLLAVVLLASVFMVVAHLHSILGERARGVNAELARAGQ